jgi:D-galactarolactone cycloisomerase
VKEPLEQVNGWLDVPTKAGLGVEVDRAVLDKHRL